MRISSAASRNDGITFFGSKYKVEMNETKDGAFEYKHKELPKLEQAMDEKIAGVGEVTLDQKAQIEELRAEYDALPEVVKALNEIGYDDWVSAEMIPNYKHHTDAIIYNTSYAMDRILGRK